VNDSTNGTGTAWTETKDKKDGEAVTSKFLSLTHVLMEKMSDEKVKLLLEIQNSLSFP
jgi:hypothetical protein